MGRNRKRSQKKWFYGPPKAVVQVDPPWQKMRAEGNKEWYRAYLSTRHWAWLRKQVFERDGYRCTRCPSVEFLEAHHLTYVRLGRELLSDLTTLCSECHRQIHRNKNTGY